MNRNDVKNSDYTTHSIFVNDTSLGPQENGALPGLFYEEAPDILHMGGKDGKNSKKKRNNMYWALSISHHIHIKNYIFDIFTIFSHSILHFTDISWIIWIKGLSKQILFSLKKPKFSFLVHSQILNTLTPFPPSKYVIRNIIFSNFNE